MDKHYTCVRDWALSFHEVNLPTGHYWQVASGTFSCQIPYNVSSTTERQCDTGHRFDMPAHTVLYKALVLIN